jgi:hypothetical protein
MVSMPFILSNEMGGPIWAAVATIYVIVILLAVYVCVDCFLPKRQARLGEIFEPRVLYWGLSAFYLLCVFAVWTPSVPRGWSLVPVFLTPLELAIGATYLLRVDFPAPPTTIPAGEDASQDADPSSPPPPTERPTD